MLILASPQETLDRIYRPGDPQRQRGGWLSPTRVLGAIQHREHRGAQRPGPWFSAPLRLAGRVILLQPAGIADMLRPSYEYGETRAAAATQASPASLPPRAPAPAKRAPPRPNRMRRGAHAPPPCPRPLGLPGGHAGESSLVTLEQAVAPRVMPPGPLMRMVRGMCARTVSNMMADLQAEIERRRAAGGAAGGGKAAGQHHAGGHAAAAPPRGGGGAAGHAACLSAAALDLFAAAAPLNITIEL